AELKDYLTRITAAPFQIQGDDRELPPDCNLISVGRTRLPAQYGIRSDQLGLEKEGFWIRTKGNCLFLLGADDDGIQFAAYEFVEKYCGVRWFFPGEHGEEVPRRETLRLPSIDDRQAPYFKRRTMALSREHKDTPIESDYWRFGRKWKLGSSLRIVGVHTWGQIAPPQVYGPTHPEYYALVGGTRQRNWTKFDGSHEYQLCTSNPEVVRLAIEWVRKFFQDNPGVDIVSISPNDGLGFCECDRCRALDYEEPMKPGELIEIRSRPHPVITDRIFTFANAVAEGVAATHPDKRLLILAYTVYRKPPRRVKPHPNLVIQYADNADFHWDPQRKAERVGMLEQWAALTPNLDIYEYYVWGGHHPARGLTPLIAESIKRFHRLGIRLFRSQSRGDFGMSGLNYYLASKLLWDPTLDADKIVNDYCDTAFGPAGAPMRRYFDRLDELWKVAVEKVGTEATPQHPAYYLASYSPAARAELKALLAQALASARTDGQRGRVEFLTKAFRYAELSVEGVEEMLELAGHGVIEIEKDKGIFASPTQIVSSKNPGEWAPAERAEARRRLDEAIQKWEERARFMDTIKGQYIIDDRYARSSDVYYRFNPLEKLREIAAAYDAVGQ
ncbi:MAG: DUF4838 domain-containing protein, partial [Acidobacteria bacterium]